MPCTEIETAFESIPIVSFWDSTSCFDDDWDSALRLQTQKQLADASLLSLPEEITNGSDEVRKELQASLASVAEILPLVSPKLRTANCEKLAWGTPCQTPEACPSLIHASSLDCANESEGSDCTSEPQVEVVEDSLGVQVESHMPSGLPYAADKFSPPARRTNPRRPKHERAITMVPMLRAQHMDILDAQYLNDPDVRSLADKRKRRPSCAGRLEHTKSRTSGQVENSQGDINLKISPSNCRHASQTPRQLGPNAIMPVVKGRLQLQAEAAKHEIRKDAREAKLREQFRSKLSVVARPKSQARNSRQRSSSNTRSHR